MPASRRNVLFLESSSLSENETDAGQNEQRIDDEPGLPVRKPRGSVGGSYQYGFAARQASYDRRMDVNKRPKASPPPPRRSIAERAADMRHKSPSALQAAGGSVHSIN